MRLPRAAVERRQRVQAGIHGSVVARDEGTRLKRVETERFDSLRHRDAQHFLYQALDQVAAGWVSDEVRNGIMGECGGAEHSGVGRMSDKMASLHRQAAIECSPRGTA